MSLIHWWPLNGNLNDYGLESVSLSNGTSIIDNNGKIGKCYNIKDSTALYANITQLSETHPVSITAWYKFVTSTTYNPVFTYGDSATHGLCIRNNHLEWGDNSRNYDETISISQQNGIWLHIAVVYNGTNIYVYQNGELKATKTAPANGIGTNSVMRIGSFWAGYADALINDVRIYDHALSAKEVKEISKGLVLHYDFEDPYVEGTTNLANQGSWYTYWNNSGSSTQSFNDTSLVSPTNSVVFSQTQTATGNSAFGMGITTDALPSQTVTVSCWFYRSGTAGSDSFGPFIRDNDTDAWLGLLEYNGNSNYREWPTDTWLYIKKTITTDSNTGRLYLCSYTGGQGEKFAFTGWQIEQKDHATPYTSGTRVPGIIYDNSGYGYNAIQVGDIQIIPESRSGEFSLFNNASGIDNYSETGKAFIMGDLGQNMSFESITISFWAKVLATYANHSGIISLSTSDYWPTDYQTGGLAQYDGVFRLNTANGSSYVSQNITFNEWHHYALSYNGATFDIYKDGVWVGGDYASGAMGASRYIFLGLNGAGGMWRKSQIYWGDFKIFSTALSASDILAEYNRKASIDKTGNFFAGELVEGDVSNIKVTKTAITKGNHFVEGTSVVKFVDGYTELEYIESTGDQYINSGFNPSGKQVRLELDFQVTVIPSGMLGIFFGGMDSAARFHIGVYPSSSGYHPGIGNGYGFCGGYDLDRHQFKLIATNSEHKFYIDDVEKWNAITGVGGGSGDVMTNDSLPSLNLYIMGGNWGGTPTGYTAGGKFYFCKIYDNNNLVCDFIPAKRKRDNAIGLYNLVNRQFYTNAGTGSFTAGPEISGVSVIYTKEFKEL